MYMIVSWEVEMIISLYCIYGTFKQKLVKLNNKRLHNNKTVCFVDNGIELKNLW